MMAAAVGWLFARKPASLGSSTPRCDHWGRTAPTNCLSGGLFSGRMSGDSRSSIPTRIPSHCWPTANWWRIRPRFDPAGDRRSAAHPCRGCPSNAWCSTRRDAYPALVCQCQRADLLHLRHLAGVRARQLQRVLVVHRRSGEMFHIDSGSLHHIENIGQDAAEFILAFRHERPEISASAPRSAR